MILSLGITSDKRRSSFFPVLFNDEGSFHNNRQLNRHNYHYWSIKSSLDSICVDNQHHWSLNTWSGNGYLIINSYFFDNRLNGKTYLFFLQNKFPELLKEVDLAT